VFNGQILFFLFLFVPLFFRMVVQVLPSSQLFFHCPRASPEATGSSLNSPTSPLSINNFIKNWQNVEEKEEEKEENIKKIKEDLLLKELKENGDKECLLIVSLLNNNNNNKLENGKEIINNENNQRPRFSLDRLIPKELQLEITKPIIEIENNKQKIINGEFSLQKSSPHGQCQGIVFIHFQQENNFFNIKIEEEKKKIINENKKNKKINLLLFNEQRKQQNNNNNKEVSYKEQKIEKQKINNNNNSFSSLSSIYSSLPSSLRSGVTLLEQIIKSHPIWFLPHLDRQAASHLLRNQETGVFIVRGSSRLLFNNSFRSSSSVMALSVKLPKKEENEEIINNEDIIIDNLDHFLIESVGNGQSVKLQGSLHTFTSLPLLLEYYSQPEAIQEIKCSLCLPKAIIKCKSIQDLQGLALMGQGYFLNIFF
ncbi:SH2 domain-containing protein, partial [Meloidogyne graminicola]